MIKSWSLFDLRNNKKKYIDLRLKSKKLVKKWEIRICNIWVNIGSELSKDGHFQRPILIVNENLWGDLVWTIPFTTKYKKRDDKYLFYIKQRKYFWLNKATYLRLDQYKVVSKKRLIKKINWIISKWRKIPLLPESILNQIKKLLSEVHFMCTPN